MSSNTQKLRVLRSRTDHDLMLLVQREIDRGLALVDLVKSRTSPRFGQAEQALSTAMALLDRVCGLDRDSRERVDGQLTQLRTLLEQVPPYANIPPYRISAAS